MDSVGYLFRENNRTGSADSEYGHLLLYQINSMWNIIITYTCDGILTCVSIQYAFSIKNWI